MSALIHHTTRISTLMIDNCSCLTESSPADAARPTTPVNQLQHHYHPGTPLLIGNSSSSSSGTSSSTAPTPLQYLRPEQPSLTPEPATATSPNGFAHPLCTPNTTPLRFGPDSTLNRGSVTPTQNQGTRLIHSASNNHSSSQNPQDPTSASGLPDSSASYPASSYESPVASGTSQSTPSNTPQQPSAYTQHHPQQQQRHGFGSLSTVSSSGLGGSSGSLQLPGSDKAMEMVEPLTPWCLLNAKVGRVSPLVLDLAQTVTGVVGQYLVDEEVIVRSGSV